MRTILAALVVVAFSTPVGAQEYVYEGRWIVTNREIDGAMTGVVKSLGNNKWHARFYGEWQGLSYSYEVEFSGPPQKLSGTAVIDDANYVWTGSIAQEGFVGSFTGDRYVGTFTLKRKR
jgi:hypothetical protein